MGLNEEAVAFGVIPCRLGTEDRLLRTRKIAAAREWKAKMARTLGATLAEFEVPGKGGGDSLAAVLAISAEGADAILDLVLEYDTAGDLGGRAFLEANADETDVYRIFRAILDRHFPFVKDVLGMLRELARLMADSETVSPRLLETETVPEPEPSPQVSSPNGHSPTGDSAPTTSKRASTKRS